MGPARLGQALLVPVLLLGACRPGLERDVGTPVITIAQAAQVATQKYALLERYNQTGDLIFLENTLAGPAGQVDRAFFEERDFLKRPLQRQARTLRKLTVFLQRQHAYPAQFLVLRETDAVDDDGQVTPEPAYFADLFTRSSAERPWSAVLWVRLPERGVLSGLTRDREGYLVHGDTGGGAEVVDRYARYLNSVVRGKAEEPVQMAPGTFTSDLGSALREVGQYATRRGVQASMIFAGTPETVFTAETAGGGALVLGALQSTATLVDPRCFEQPTTRAAWGWLVPPGRFASIGYRNLLMFLAEVPQALTSGRPPTRIVAALGPTVVGATLIPCQARPA